MDRHAHPSVTRFSLFVIRYVLRLCVNERTRSVDLKPSTVQPCNGAFLRLPASIRPRATAGLLARPQSNRACILPAEGSSAQRRHPRSTPCRAHNTKGPAEAGPVALISDCSLRALLPVSFSRHNVLKEILVLRCEAFRKLENLKAVAIADGPELDIG